MVSDAHLMRHLRSEDDRDPFADFVPDSEFSSEVPSYIEGVTTTPPLHPAYLRQQPPHLPPQLLEIILVCKMSSFSPIKEVVVHGRMNHLIANIYPFVAFKWPKLKIQGPNILPFLGTGEI